MNSFFYKNLLYSFAAIAFNVPPPYFHGNNILHSSSSLLCLGSTFLGVNMQDSFTLESIVCLFPFGLQQDFLTWELWDVVPGNPESSTCSKSQSKNKNLAFK